MINKTYYPIEFRYTKFSDFKLTSRLQECLGINISREYDALLVIIMYTVAFSLKEAAMLYSRLSYSYASYQIKTLLSKGYIESYPFTAVRYSKKSTHRIATRKHIPFDGSRKYYCLTNEGKKHLDNIGVDTSNAFITNGELSMQHTYATGYNFVEIMKLSVRFDWVRESPFQYDIVTPKTQLGVYRTDADCVLMRKAHNHLYLHIEEDLATEKIEILVEKCEHYIKGDLMLRNRDILIFSIWTDREGNDEHRYALLPKRINRLAEEMANYYGASYVSQLIGRADIYSDQAMIEDFTDLFANIYGDKALSPKMLKEIKKRIEARIEPALLANKNIYLARGAFNRLLSFVRKVTSFHREKDCKYEKPDKYILLTSGICIHALFGNPILFIPTPLLAKKIPLFYPDITISIFTKRLEVSLAKYFHTFHYEYSISDVLFHTIDTKVYSGISFDVCLRNAFAYSLLTTWGILCVEYMAYDAGAWIRALAFDVYINSFTTNHRIYDKIPITLLLIFDTIPQKETFFRACEYRHTLDGLNYKGLNIVYMVTEEIGNETAKLKSVTPNDSDIELVDLSPKN